MTAADLWRRTVTGIESELPAWGSSRFTPAALAATGLLTGLALAAGQYTQILVSVGCAYLVASLGYNLILGYAGQMAFCQAGFMAVGAYVLAVLEAGGTAPLLAIAVAIVASGAVAALIGVAVLRTRGVYLALVTLAFAQAIIVLINLWPASQGENGISVSVPGQNGVLVAALVAGASLFVVERLVRSRFGRALAMVRLDEEAAAAMGVHALPVRVLAFTLGGMLGGAGGVLLSGALGFIAPSDFGTSLTLLLLTIVVVGGVESVWGTLIGTVLLVALSQYLANSLGYQDIIYGAVLFVVLVLRPRGLVSAADPLRRALERRGREGAAVRAP